MSDTNPGIPVKEYGGDYSDFAVGVDTNVRPLSYDTPSGPPAVGVIDYDALSKPKPPGFGIWSTKPSVSVTAWTTKPTVTVWTTKPSVTVWTTKPTVWTTKPTVWTTTTTESTTWSTSTTPTTTWTTKPTVWTTKPTWSTTRTWSSSTTKPTVWTTKPTMWTTTTTVWTTTTVASTSTTTSTTSSIFTQGSKSWTTSASTPQTYQLNRLMKPVKSSRLKPNAMKDIFNQNIYKKPAGKQNIKLLNTLRKLLIR